MRARVIKRTRAKCQTKTCQGHAAVLCDYPVTRAGRRASCGRHICATCCMRLAGRFYCPPHGRLRAAAIKEQAAERADDEKLRRILAEFRPSAECADRCPCGDWMRGGPQRPGHPDGLCEEYAQKEIEQ